MPLLRLALVLGLVAACGAVTSQDVIARETAATQRSDAARESARKHYLTEHALEPIEAAAIHLDLAQPVPVASAPARGLDGSEQLAMLAEGDRLGLVTTSSGCGCGGDCTGPEYQIATTGDGHVVVLRLSPRVHVEHLHQQGACGVGCGMPPPGPVRTAIGLPVRDPALVTVVEVPYDLHEVQVSCDREIPRP